MNRASTNISADELNLVVRTQIMRQVPASRDRHNSGRRRPQGSTASSSDASLRTSRKRREPKRGKPGGKTQDNEAIQGTESSGSPSDLRGFGSLHSEAMNTTRVHSAIMLAFKPAAARGVRTAYAFGPFALIANPSTLSTELHTGNNWIPLTSTPFNWRRTRTLHPRSTLTPSAG